MLLPMPRTAVALLLLLVACGDGGQTASPPSPSPQATIEPEDSVDAEEPEEEPPPSEECTDETITGAVEVTIRQNDNAFSPACLIVLGGQGLEILNRGETLHNFTIEGSQVSLDTRPGKATRTEALAGVLEPGTHKFICKYHFAEGMRGEITLTEAG
jgi:plastocyanin